MIIQTATTSFKLELPQAIHDFSTDVFKVALYGADATLNADTTAYTAGNEVVAAGYTAGGEALTAALTSAGGQGLISFAPVTFAAALTARGALIYNSSKADRAVAVLNFGSDKTSTTAFTITFPPALANTAVIRIS